MPEDIKNKLDKDIRVLIVAKSKGKSAAILNEINPTWQYS